MTSKNNLTSRPFWQSYWKTRSAHNVDAQVFFQEQKKFFPAAPQRFIEIGGFPGTYSIYFRKFHGYDTSLLDYIIDPRIVADSAKLSDVDPHHIHLIEGDLFSLPAPAEKYEVVFSAGFIEHFQDARPVFQKHLDYLAAGGLLFISVPNFLGISGWAQKFLDRENYSAHSLACMHKSFLEKQSHDAGLEILFLDYTGTPHIWLDRPERHLSRTRVWVGIVSALLQKMRFLKGRLFSPYLILIARKRS